MCGHGSCEFPRLFGMRVTVCPPSLDMEILNIVRTEFKVHHRLWFDQYALATYMSL